MKNLISIIIILGLATPIFAQTGAVVVNVTGIENNKGIIQIGLYNSEASFPVYEKNFKGVFPKAKTSGVSYTFTNIPAGTYAIALWHDADEDGTMNKNMFGVPKEKYGFSRNIYGTFGPPDFKDVAFKVNSAKKITLKIKLE